MFRIPTWALVAWLAVIIPLGVVLGWWNDLG